MRFSVLAGALLVARGSAFVVPQQASPLDASEGLTVTRPMPTPTGGLDDIPQLAPAPKQTYTLSPGTPLPTPGPPQPYVWCSYAQDGSDFNDFHISAFWWPKEEAGCGKSILNNVRARTNESAVLDWTCDDSGQGTDVTFKLSTGFHNTPNNVVTAIQVAKTVDLAPFQCDRF